MFSVIRKIAVISLFTVTFSVEKAQAFAWDFFSQEKKSERQYIYIVGSSTVSPLIAAVSEEFTRKENLNSQKVVTPVVESSGTKEGIRLFCQGVGKKYPDFVNASRPIHEEELAECRKNGINDPLEIKIGYDGIVIGNFVGNKMVKLSKEHIFKALAKRVYDPQSKKLVKNPYNKWSQIDKKLPNEGILIYGPPKTSGTREVFIDMLMSAFCSNDERLLAAYSGAKDSKNKCLEIRGDNRFIASGENDSLIVKNLKDNPKAFGILGFNFLAVNRHIIQATSIDGVRPTAANIASKKYQLSRPLFIYLKKEHLELIPEIREFLLNIVDSKTIGKKGYLVHSGLVPLSKRELRKVKDRVLLEINQ